MISKLMNLNNYPPGVIMVIAFTVGVIVGLAVEYFNGE